MKATHTNHPARRTGGFTLVELLLAIGVMAVLAGLSWRGIDSMVRSRDITEERSAQVLALQAGLAQWVADLDATEPTGQVAPIDWDGQVLRLTRRAPPSEAASLRVVAWSRRVDAQGGQWLRWESGPVSDRTQLLEAWAQAARWAQNPDDILRRREVAIAPLLEWQLFYYRSDAWTNPLSSAAGAPPVINIPGAAPSIAPAPDGVRLVLQLPDSGAVAGRLTRDWVQPTLGRGKS